MSFGGGDLYRAVVQNDVAKIRALIAEQRQAIRTDSYLPFVMATDNAGWHAMYAAAHYGNLRAVDALLESAPEFSNQMVTTPASRSGNTPLHALVARWYEVEDVHSQLHRERHVIVQVDSAEERIQILARLLQHGADLLAENDAGDLPLHAMLHVLMTGRHEEPADFAPLRAMLDSEAGVAAAGGRVSGSKQVGLFNAAVRWTNGKDRGGLDDVIALAMEMGSRHGDDQLARKLVLLQSGEHGDTVLHKIVKAPWEAAGRPATEVRAMMVSLLSVPGVTLHDVVDRYGRTPDTRGVGRGENRLLLEEACAEIAKKRGARVKAARRK